MSKVAVVDDSKIARMFAKWALTPSGLEIEEILPNGVIEVLGELRRFEPQLLVLDVMMPTCPGKELLQAIRRDETLKSLPVILLTALWDKADLAPFIALGVSGYLHKPVDPKALKKAVEELLV